MTKQVTEQKGEPSLEITRERGYISTSGERQQIDRVFRRRFDSSRRASRLDFTKLTKLSTTANQNQEYSSGAWFYNWSGDGNVCEFIYGDVSLFGSFKPKHRERVTFDCEGNVVKTEQFEPSSNIWKEGGLFFQKEKTSKDNEGRLLRIERIGSRFELSYDSHGRLSRVLSFYEGKPQAIQQIEYFGNMNKITVHPFLGMASHHIHIYDSNGLGSYRWVNSPNKIISARYVEKRIKKIGQDKDGREYQAILTKGWLEDIASGKVIDGNIFREIKITK